MPATRVIDISQVQYKTLTIEGQEIFYREAGPVDKPTILLLHGFPASSFMFRNLMIALGDKYHLVAPDYRGFGNSSIPGNAEIQVALFYSYRTNPARYPEWQQYFQTYQPPTLITWGGNDQIFPASGAKAYLKDLPNAELHILDTGHFALEEEGTQIAALIDRFLTANIK